MKLSKAQVALLRKFAEGDKLCEMHGLDAHFFWFGEHAGPAVQYRTVYRLRDLGLIKKLESDWRSTTWGITPAGRKYLEEHGGKDATE